MIGALVACGASDPAPAALDPCHVHLEPGEDDALSVQSALLGAAPGNVICLEAGTYRMADGLSLGVPGLTLRSAGGDAILDFSSQRSRAPGLEVTGDDVTIEGLELRGARGAAVRVMGADNVRVASLRVHWADANEEHTDGVALYGASNTHVHEVEVLAASGFGLRVTGSMRTLVEGSSLHHNAVGVWVEGGSDLEVTGTEMRGNRAGLVLATDAAGRGERAKLHGNLVEGSRGGDLDEEPFSGLGIAVVGPYAAEIHDNLVRSNDTAGLFVLPGDGEGAHFFLSVRDNRFIGNGGGAAPEQDVVLKRPLEEDAGAPLCFESNEGAIQAEGLALDGGCPAPSLPSLTL